MLLPSEHRSWCSNCWLAVFEQSPFQTPSYLLTLQIVYRRSLTSWEQLLSFTLRSHLKRSFPHGMVEVELKLKTSSTFLALTEGLGSTRATLVGVLAMPASIKWNQPRWQLRCGASYESLLSVGSRLAAHLRCSTIHFRRRKLHQLTPPIASSE